MWIYSYSTKFFFCSTWPFNYKIVIYTEDFFVALLKIFGYLLLRRTLVQLYHCAAHPISVIIAHLFRSKGKPCYSRVM